MTMGLQPSEFWEMTTQEWWWMFDHKLVTSERIKDPGHTSQSEWDAARQKHREKMAAKKDKAND